MKDLTTREREVLGLAAEGLSDKDIARRLGTSENTVGVQLVSVYRKLGVSSRVEAANRLRQLVPRG